LLQEFRHSDLPHEFVLASVHARESANVRKNILKGVRELEGVNIAKTVLDMCINDKLRQAKNSTQVKSISKTRLQVLIALSQRGLIEHLASTNLLVNEVQHILSLPANLQPSLDPVQPHYPAHLAPKRRPREGQEARFLVSACRTTQRDWIYE
jgi:hypothetical protein